MIRIEGVHLKVKFAITRTATVLAIAVMTFSISSHASILWSRFGTTLVRDPSGNGVLLTV